jgi:hypothetical protein
LDGLLFGLGAGIVAGIAFGRGNKMPKWMRPLRWRQLLRRRPLVVGLLAGTVAGVAFGLIIMGSPPSSGVIIPSPSGPTTFSPPSSGVVVIPSPSGPTTGSPPSSGAVVLSPSASPIGPTTTGTTSSSWDLVVLRDALGFGLATGFVAWLGAGLVAGMSRPGTDNTSPLSPLSSWRSDRKFGLVAGLVFGLVFGLSVWFLFGLSTGLSAGLSFGLWSALSFGLMAGLMAGIAFGLVYPQTWSSSLAFAQLAASDRTPVRLMRFLEDARRRSVLRTVGPIYQFRHARLQDRLAAQEPATGREPNKPLPATGSAAAPTAEAPPASAI